MTLARTSRLLATAVIVGISAGLTLVFLGAGDLLNLIEAPAVKDWEAYWNAATRIANGQALFPPVLDPAAADVYRYPPWFAIAWVPLTALQRDVAATAWIGLMFLAAAAAVGPLILSRRRPAVLLAALLLPFFVQAASNGNVQPLLIALLVHGVDRWWGPLAVGIAASLKGFPLLYVGVYLLRGQWRAAAISATFTLVLAAPILLVDLSSYPTSPGPLIGLWLLTPAAWAVGAAVGVAALIRFARGPGDWFAASLAVVMASPRLLYYDLTYLLVTGRELFADHPVHRDSELPAVPSGNTVVADKAR